MAQNGFYYDRLKVCNECEFFNQTLKVCEICNCFIPAKARFIRFKCPKNKWVE